MLRYLIIALAGLGPAGQDADLGWLVGSWCTDQAQSGARTCEHWTAMAGGVMEGQTIVYRAGTSMIETMRITVEPDRLVFHAEPQGQEPADFHASGAVPAMGVRFENRAHDYPQVVRYWREGEMLMAEISLADGSKPQRWAYRREKE